MYAYYVKSIGPKSTGKFKVKSPKWIDFLNKYYGNKGESAEPLFASLEFRNYCRKVLKLRGYRYVVGMRVIKEEK